MTACHVGINITSASPIIYIHFLKFNTKTLLLDVMSFRAGTSFYASGNTLKYLSLGTLSTEIKVPGMGEKCLLKRMQNCGMLELRIELMVL